MTCTTDVKYDVREDVLKNWLNKEFGDRISPDGLVVWTCTVISAGHSSSWQVTAPREITSVGRAAPAEARLAAQADAHFWLAEGEWVDVDKMLGMTRLPRRLKGGLLLTGFCAETKRGGGKSMYFSPNCVRPIQSDWLLAAAREPDKSF